METIARFGVVGLLGTATHISVALLADALFVTSAVGANLVGFGVAVIVSYFGHLRLTFNVSPQHGFQLPRFSISALIGLVVSSFFSWLIHDQLNRPFWMAMLIVGITVPVLTYVLLSKFVFISSRKEMGHSFIGVYSSILVVLLFLVAIWDQPVSHDVAWYLVATRKWLTGAELYADIIEVNPPLNFYLTIPVVLLADTIGVKDGNAQYIVFSVLLLVVLIWSWNVIRAREIVSLPLHALFHVLLSLAAILPALDNIGQRDHLFVIFVLPWLFGLIPSKVSESKKLIIERACFASLGICLKPYFLLLPILITIWEFSLKKSLAPLFSVSNLVFLTIGMSYLFFVWLFHPLYFSEIVPISLYVYQEYGFENTASILSIDFLIPAFFVATFLLSNIFSTLFYNHRIPAFGLFIVAAISGLGSYLLQWTGYQYQAIPFFTFSLIAAGWIIASNPKLSVSWALAVFAFQLLVALNFQRGFYSNEVTNELVQNLTNQSSVFTMSTHVFTGPPVALATGAEWASRYPALWLVPGSVNGLAEIDCGNEANKCRTLNEIADRTRHEIVEDITQFQPEVIVIDRMPGYINVRDFDWWKFMLATPRFNSAMLAYNLHKSLGRFDIWIRK